MQKGKKGGPQSDSGPRKTRTEGPYHMGQVQYLCITAYLVELSVAAGERSNRGRFDGILGVCRLGSGFDVTWSSCSQAHYNCEYIGRSTS